ncbi:MAG: hypothetical protein F4029_15175 [Gammaproteobacteria bacterium]|nr:hypothetical protein [Gammaproteobacteria bacterium]MYF30476.1 hypothetical protein [Gammaproteobacteria bacterium]MYK47558.1 hypothetical protein [Gammaproteobacteria bacterium]
MLGRRAIIIVAVYALVSMGCIGARLSVAAAETNPDASETPTGSALAPIMAIGNRFERNAALYRFVAEADRQRIEALLAGLAAEPRVPQRDDAARILYVRFASLDPGAAVEHALRSQAKPLVLEAVFRAWAHVDLEVAVARASSLSRSIKQDAARAILDLDLTASERTSIAERLGTQPGLVAIEHVAPPRADEPYEEALARIAAVTDGRARYGEVVSVSGAWAAKDPIGALAALLDWEGNEDLRGFWLGQVMDAWADTDARAAVDWLLTQDERELASLAGSAFAALARSDLAEAESLVAILPEGQARLAAQISVFSVILGQGQLDIALAAFEELDLRNRQRYSLGVGRRLAREDPEWAVAWTMDLEDPIRSNTLGWVLASIQESDPELAKQLAEQVDDTSLRIRAAQVLVQRGEPSEAVRWATTLGSEAETAPLVARVFAIWSAREFPAAMDAAMEYPSGTVRDRALRSMMASRLRVFDTDAAEQLLKAIESPTEKAKAEAQLRAHRNAEDRSAGRSP